jgi:DNA uptake protein ComE-like DNA-binding protein
LGIFVLIILIGTEIFTRVYQPPQPDLDVIMALVDSLDSGHSRASKAPSRWQDTSRTYFDFDPNTLSDSGFAALGFSEREIQTLRKYQKAGGEFRKKSDFAKLYFVDEQVFRMLEPHIDLPEENDAYEPQKNFNKQEKQYVKWSDTASIGLYKYEPFTVDLNKADTSELKNLNGIGSFYAKKIVERRQELGGYHNIGQLMELWKMTPETIDKFAYQVTIDLSRLKKLNVNSATAQELAAHPYIPFDLASRLVHKREESGPFIDMASLKATGLLDAELSLKLAPYLEFKQ